MRDGECPPTSAKIRLSVAIYKPGRWMPLEGPRNAGITGTQIRGKMPAGAQALPGF